MQIDIFSDTICPWCYIGKRRLEEALEVRPNLEVAITWHPFELNPDLPLEGVDRAAYIAAKFGGDDKADEAYGPILEAGRALGIPFAFEKRMRVPNTARSHAVIFWAQQEGVGNAVVEALFQAYFTRGMDIGNPAVLADIAESEGLDRELVEARLAAGFNLDEVRAVSEKARGVGLSGVPCFIIDRKYALVGAQESAVFLDLFDKIERGEE